MLLERKQGFYEKYIKRLLDIICSLLFIILLCWLYVIIALIVRIKMGSPVLFKQPRPGIVKNGRETIFDMYKFRTMTDERDKDGNLLPDDKRLPKFGAMLRSTSLDELPEVFCILRGTMSIVGPRPQLVRDMVFMSDEQRMRHTAKPGLTGLAQVKGRNAITWEEKLDWDLKYIENVSFWNDINIVLKTVVAVLNKSGITDGENVTSMDYGDWLLKCGNITNTKYEELQEKAKEILEE
ncbi:Sugar transferase involved in LPS biosynthesis (colanic, teichoic acid) [Oribacterium sp. KHPX15]|uniref:sugar transferase n=1 Tax=Oribacterium sp. KHPX15 TaxID=1855342 RepID=UPI000899EBA7|nr:sugar transferase [Oribacterium sp. KHPX15]SEA81411.1 Sugar transferase involved in LPS biosynthesis (colanic, teichoic acid) [Oribacterium sp. KHPX15]